MKPRYWLFIAVYLLAVALWWGVTRYTTLADLLLLGSGVAVVSLVITVKVIRRATDVSAIIGAFIFAAIHVVAIRLIIAFYHLHLAGII